MPPKHLPSPLSDPLPTKAKLLSRAEDYPWCGFSAACGGDARCVDDHLFIYTFAPLEWPEIRTSHEKSIAFAEKAGLIRISGKADRFSPHKLFELTARRRVWPMDTPTTSNHQRCQNLRIPRDYTICCEYVNI